jgi:hypothetical protein
MYRRSVLVLLLAALSLSALTTLLAAALSGLLLLLAWLLLAAAALLLARLVLTALLLAGILLVRIVHNFSYFDSSPVMTTILTPRCSRFELNLRLLWLGRLIENTRAAAVPTT